MAETKPSPRITAKGRRVRLLKNGGTNRRDEKNEKRSIPSSVAIEPRQKRITCIDEGKSRLGAAHGNPPLCNGNAGGKPRRSKQRKGYQKRYGVSTSVLASTAQEIQRLLPDDAMAAGSAAVKGGNVGPLSRDVQANGTVQDAMPNAPLGGVSRSMSGHRFQ